MKPGWHTDRGDYKLFVFRCPPQETFHPTSIVPMTGAATMASHGLKTISSTSSTFLPTGPGKIVGQWVNTCFQWANAAMGSSSAQGDRNRPLQMSSTWVRVLPTLAKLRPVGVISCFSFSCISTHMFTFFWLLVKWEYCTGKWMLRLHLWIYFSILHDHHLSLYEVIQDSKGTFHKCPLRWAYAQKHIKIRLVLISVPLSAKEHHHRSRRVHIPRPWITVGIAVSELLEWCGRPLCGILPLSQWIQIQFWNTCWSITKEARCLSKPFGIDSSCLHQMKSSEIMDSNHSIS